MSERENIVKIDQASFKPVVMASSEPKSDEIRLGKEDLGQLSDKVRAEEASLRQLAEMQIVLSRMNAQMAQAVTAAEAAKEARNKFCVEVEQKYKVPKGASWVVDFDKGLIVVKAPQAALPQG